MSKCEEHYWRRRGGLGDGLFWTLKLAADGLNEWEDLRGKKDCSKVQQAIEPQLAPFR